MFVLVIFEISEVKGCHICTELTQLIAISLGVYII